MKITVQFESLAEFQKFIGAAEEIAEEKKEKKTLTAEELNKSAQKTADIINAAEAKEEAEKAEKKKPKADPEEPKAELKEVDYGALRVECRQVLAALNKAAGKNVAREMFAAHGAKDGKLSQIADMVLPALLEEAKEALEDAN